MFLFIATLLIIFFWLTLTHLMGRFFVPAIPLLAMLVGFLGMDKPWSLITAGTVAVVAIISFVGLHIAFTQSVNDSHAYQGLLRLRDFTELWPAQLADIEKTGGKLALIGDAQAFYRPLPISRLEYRSIFDVVVPPEKNIVDAWLGRDLEGLRKITLSFSIRRAESPLEYLLRHSSGPAAVATSGRSDNHPSSIEALRSCPAPPGSSSSRFSSS